MTGFVQCTCSQNNEYLCGVVEEAFALRLRKLIHWANVLTAVPEFAFPWIFLRRDLVQSLIVLNLYWSWHHDTISFCFSLVASPSLFVNVTWQVSSWRFTFVTSNVNNTHTMLCWTSMMTWDLRWICFSQLQRWLIHGYQFANALACNAGGKEFAPYLGQYFGDFFLKSIPSSA